MGNRDAVVEMLEAWIKDFRAAAISHIDNGGDPPDMLNVASLVANSRANRRARERQQQRGGIEVVGPGFGRN